MYCQFDSSRKHQWRGCKRVLKRKALAPLELILVLPFLLCVMALIVNFSHAATWKIRAATGARLAMWRHRPMWHADVDPKPVNLWPPKASVSESAESRISQVDPIWNQTSIGQAWIKGPIFIAGGGYLRVRDNRVNEMGEGTSQGHGDVSLPYPFLPSMGAMSINAEHSLLDSVWQYHTMGYAYNDSRRANGWWQLEDDRQWRRLKRSFLWDDDRMRHNPMQESLRPLDRDWHLMRYSGTYDFYPRLTPVCSENPQDIHNEIEREGGLLDRIRGDSKQGIRGVCRNMASSYLRVYEALLRQQLRNYDPEKPSIADLTRWIYELKDYLSKLVD